MKNYPLEKYKFIINENKKQVIAITHDAGESIRGSATCHPSDKFDVEYGKKLAAARANFKVAIRRKKRAEKAVAEAINIANIANSYLEDAYAFEDDSNELLSNAITELGKFDA